MEMPDDVRHRLAGQAAATEALDDFNLAANLVAQAVWGALLTMDAELDAKDAARSGKLMTCLYIEQFCREVIERIDAKMRADWNVPEESKAGIEQEIMFGRSAVASQFREQARAHVDKLIAQPTPPWVDGAEVLR